MTILNLVITSDADDGFDNGSSWDDRDTPYTSAEYFFVTKTPGKDERGGLRFVNVMVPNAEVINSATLTVHRNGQPGGALSSITVYGDDVDNASTWGALSRPQSGFTNTTASATNSSLPSTNVDFTFDVTAIIQELVDRGGWVSGNAVRFALVGAATYGIMEITDYDLVPTDTTADAATLDIDFGGVQIDTAPTTILRNTEFDVIISNASVSGIGATLTIGGEPCIINTWPGVSGVLKATFDGDLLYDKTMGSDLVLTDPDTTVATVSGIFFIPTVLNDWIDLSSPNWSSVNFMLFGFEGTPNPVNNDQMEFVKVTTPSSTPQTPPPTSEWVLGSMPTVTQTSDVWIIRAATSIRSAVWQITYPVAQLINLILVDFSNSPQINLTGLKWSFFDESQPQLLTTPTASGTIETTDGSGNIEIDVTGTTLVSGQTGFLIISDTDGTSTQSPASKAFAAPVDIT